MTSVLSNIVSIQKSYLADCGFIYNLFQEGVVFDLTGADSVKYDFKIGGQFELIFSNRGTIYGRFIEITNDNVIIDWNVDGFRKPSERDTLVEIRLSQSTEGCDLSLNHKNIMHPDSASAKKRAWTEILDEITKIVSIK